MSSHTVSMSAAAKITSRTVKTTIVATSALCVCGRREKLPGDFVLSDVGLLRAHKHADGFGSPQGDGTSALFSWKVIDGGIFDARRSP